MDGSVTSEVGHSGFTYCSSISLRLVCDTASETVPQRWQSLPVRSTLSAAVPGYRRGEGTEFISFSQLAHGPLDLQASNSNIYFLSLQRLGGAGCRVGGKAE